jgi:hypothetical protein
MTHKLHSGDDDTIDLEPILRGQNLQLCTTPAWAGALFKVEKMSSDCTGLLVAL